jgi:hypothetical protein
MPQLPPIYADDFNLNATWDCYGLFPSNGDSYDDMRVWHSPQEPDASNTVTFAYELPKRATIKHVKVHSKWSGSTHGINKKTVNGVEVDADGFAVIETPDESANSIAVEFAFVAGTDDIWDAHSHVLYQIADGGEDDRAYSVGSHTSSVKVTEVYLLIEYEDDQGGYIYHAENGVLVPYNFYRAEGGVLVPYNMFGVPHDYEIVTQNLLTADGENLRTSDDKQFKVTGGE